MRLPVAAHPIVDMAIGQRGVSCEIFTDGRTRIRDRQAASFVTAVASHRTALDKPSWDLGPGKAKITAVW